MEQCWDVMAWRTQLWGLGVLLGPLSSSNAPGLLPPGLAGNPWAAPGAPARSQLLNGIPEALPALDRFWDTPRAAKPRRDWTEGNGDRAEGQQCPGQQQGQAKGLVVLPVVMLGSPKLPGQSTLPAPAFWLLQGPQQDPPDELGTTKPREPGPCRWPGRGG